MSGPVRKKILLGQLGRRGDCLYATAVARQIKHDFPDCELTWAVNSACRPIVDGNPFVDTIWEVPHDDGMSQAEEWYRFEAEALERKGRGEFDEVYFTQIPPRNFQSYDGTSRSSLFRNYPHPITESIQPVLRLSDQEVAHVSEFVSNLRLMPGQQVVLFECASTSGQSYVTPDFALRVASSVVKHRPDVCFILSSNDPLPRTMGSVFDGSVLSFRENAELTKYCSLLVGCSSGISWLATSDWAKPLPQIQVLSHKTRMYASMLHDALYFGLPTDSLIELQDISADRLAQVIRSAIEKGIQYAKERFQKDVRVKFDFYLSQLHSMLLSERRFKETAKAIGFAAKRYQYDPHAWLELNTIIKRTLKPYLDCFAHLLTDSDLEALAAIGYTPARKGMFLASVNAIATLGLQSFFGANKSAARPLLLDIIRSTLKRFH